MMEIERKILEIDVGKVKRAILKLPPTGTPASRPKKLFEGLLRINYWDFPDHRIYKKRDLLRVREFVPAHASGRGNSKPYTELVYKTYKGVKYGCKYFDECEVNFVGPGHGAQIGAFLEKLEVKKVLYYEKKRTLFAWGKIKFEIDEHPKIPPFMEIEAPSPMGINRAIIALGIQDHEQTSETIGELLARKYKKVKLNGLVF